MTEHYQLPTGWTWRDVVAQRVKWDISERFYPVTSVAGVCTGWGRPIDNNCNWQPVDE